MDTDPDIAAIGALLGVPARAAMLCALADGEALPAGELAYRAFVSPQTASTHLAKMVAGGLLSVERCGRHRYYRMATAEAAQVVEQIMTLAPPAKRRVRAGHALDVPLRAARTCYGHLAGRLGVAVAEALSVRGVVQLAGQDYQVTSCGERWFSDFGIELETLGRQRRMFARRCIDWSERRPHIGGALGDALSERLFELVWIRRAKGSRAVYLTDHGKRQLQTTLGVSV